MVYYFPDPKCVKGGHELIEDAIGTDEPFEVTLGFSQGVVSYLLHHCIESPLAPPAFECGIFFSCAIIQSPDHDYKRKELMYLLEALTAEQTSSLHKYIWSPTGTQKDFADAPFTKGLELA